VTGCPCSSELNVLVCRSNSCGWSGRFINSAPFIAGAIAIFASAALARFTIDRLLKRTQPSESDAADFADFVAEASGLVGALLVFAIGVIVVISADNLQAIVVLLSVLIILPLIWIVWSLISQEDAIRYVRNKRGHVLGWRSYALAAANFVAVILVFLVI
jgi:hypothetical protein